jgi:hypothetical protein
MIKQPGPFSFLFFDIRSLILYCHLRSAVGFSSLITDSYFNSLRTTRFIHG